MGYIGAGITRFNTADELTVTGDAQIDTTTLVVDSTNNRVGIGTASPATALDVAGTVTADGLDLGAATDAATVSTTASDYQLQLGAADSTTGDIGRNISFDSLGITTASINTIDDGASSSTNLAFFTGNNSALRNRLEIASNGDISFYDSTGVTQGLFWDASTQRLGVNTTSPDVPLNVESAASATRIKYAGTSNAHFGLQIESNISGGNFESDFANGTTAMLDLFANSTNTSGGDFLVARTQASDPVLLVKGNGNVGIGVTPSAWGSAWVAAQVGVGSTIAGRTTDYTNTNIVSNAYFDGTNWKYLSSNTASKYYQLSGSHIWDTAASGTAGNNITFSEAARLDSSQNLLVGTTDVNIGTNSGTAVTGGVISGGTATFGKSGNRALVLNRGTSDGNIAEFRFDGSSVGSIGSFNGNAYYAGTGCGLRPRTGDISPTNASGSTNDGGVDLGTSSNRFQNIFLSGGAYLGGTAAANKLDDYEEGDFTPAIWEGTSAIGDAAYNTSFTKGTYIKIGRMVMITMSLRLTSKGTPTGSSNFRIGGFPFTTTNDVKARSAFATYDHDATGIDTSGNTTGTLHAFISNGVNYLGFRVSDPSQAAAETLTYDDLGNDTYLQLTGTIVVD